MEIKIKIRTLTPLWTGDVDRKCSKIKETGIIGSLRWWYEALVRGFGGYACDPTSERRCELDQKRFKKAIREGKSIQEALDEQICPVCQLFGCTGWSRRFRLEVNRTQTRKLFFVTSLQTNQWWLKKIWENQDEVIYGNTCIKVTAPEIATKRLLAIIWLISKYGGVGAKTHMGFGQIVVEGLDEKEIKKGFKEIKKSKKDCRSNPYWYNLFNFFILKFKIYDDDPVLKYYVDRPFFVKTLTFPPDWGGEYIPCSFDIKYYGKIEDKEFGLRYHFKKKFGRGFAEELFGYSRGEEKFGGRVFVSHLYRGNVEDPFYYLKIWAFLPPSLNSRLRDIKDEVKNHIEGIFEKSEIIVEETGEDLIRRVIE